MFGSRWSAIGRSRTSRTTWGSSRRQAEADSGKRTDLLSTQEREEIRRLRKENYELRRSNEILKSASLLFAASSTRTVRSEPTGLPRSRIHGEVRLCWRVGGAPRPRPLR